MLTMQETWFILTVFYESLIFWGPMRSRKLKTFELTFLRIETSTGNFDCDIKPKNAEVLRKQIELIADAK